MAYNYRYYLRMDDILLIENVRIHEFLYNNRLADYRDQNIRQTAWEEIGKELQIPGYKAKERWEILRRCFCNARSRRRDNIKNGLVSKKKHFWKYEQQMSFVLPFLEIRKTHGHLNGSQASVNLEFETDNNALLEASEAEENIQGHIHLDINNEQGDTQDDQTVDVETHFNDTETIEKCYESVQRNKKQKQVKHRYETKCMCPQASITTSLLKTLDDTDMFFLSMSRMTKQLPKVEQAQIKLSLSNSVLSAELKYIQQLSLSLTP